MTDEKKRVLAAAAIAIAAVIVASAANAGINWLASGGKGDSGETAQMTETEAVQASAEETEAARAALEAYAGTSWADGEGDWMYIQSGNFGEWNDSTDKIRYYRVDTGRVDDAGNLQATLTISQDDPQLADGETASIAIETTADSGKRISGSALEHEYELREANNGKIALANFDAGLDIWRGHTEEEFEKAIEKAIAATAPKATKADWCKGATISYEKGETVSTQFTLDDPSSTQVYVSVTKDKVTANV